MKRYVIPIIGLITLIISLTSYGQSKEVINEVKTQLEEDPTIVTDAIIELPNGDHVTIQKSIFEI